MLVPTPCKGGVDVRINSVKNMRHTDAAETEALYIPVDEGGCKQPSSDGTICFSQCSQKKK